MKKSIANILFREGYIDAFEEIEDKGQGTIRIIVTYFRIITGVIGYRK